MDAVPGPGEGETLLAGRYDVGALVGLGGTAQVYRAWDHQGGCPVAVKIFRPGSAPAPGYGGGRELAVLTGVRHAGLVGVRGAGIDAQGCPFVVMDLVDGDSLSARLHDGPLTAAAVVRLGAVLADALAVVHARGIVHRDVKPANVLLDTAGHPWLTDFGIARIVDATRVTATGVVVGTAAYMAPEQVRGEAVGPPADVYALGLVLLEAVTGRREYEGGALESALARLHRAPVVPPGLADPLAATLRRMTAPHPEDRPTASEVTALLQPRPARGAPRRTRVAAGTVGRRVAPVAALACLVAGASAGALSLAGPERPAGEPHAVLVPAAAPPVPLALPPVVPDAAGVAEVPAPASAPKPVPVALRNPDRTPPRTGTGTAPRAEGRSGSDDATGTDDAKDDARDDAKDDAPREADRDARADRDEDDHDAAEEEKNEKVDDDGDRGGGGHGDDDDRKGSGRSGKGKSGHSGSDDG